MTVFIQAYEHKNILDIYYSSSVLVAMSWTNQARLLNKFLQKKFTSQ